MAENDKRPMVGVLSLIMKGDRVLLIKRSQNVHGPGTWAPPGGHIEYGETPDQATIRETKEEVDLTINNPKFRTMTNDVFEAEQKHYITIWMETNDFSGEPKLQAPREETDIGWFTWDSLPEPLFLSLQNLLAGKTYPPQTGGVWHQPGVIPPVEDFPPVGQ